MTKKKKKKKSRKLLEGGYLIWLGVKKSQSNSKVVPGSSIRGRARRGRRDLNHDLTFI